MKSLKYIFLSAAIIGFTACSDDDSNGSSQQPLPELTAGQADFSKYVAVGASFSAGFTDNALFIAGQQNSFPNLMSQKMGLVGGGSFGQPLMSDNIGGFLVNGTVASSPRLFFDGSGPAVLPATPTTEITAPVSGPFNNYGIPGIKSFHLGIAGYGSLNPYFGRMASGTGATVIGDAVAQAPTFFTFSEIGGNDVLAYATSGGTGVDQTGNMDPSTYGGSDITDPTVFAASFSASIDALTANGAKGVVANVPYITSLAHFTTVPYNPLDPSNPQFGPQIPTLNATFAQLNAAYAFLGVPERSVVYSETEASPVLIHDESLADISTQLTLTLIGGGLDPITAGILGNQFGQSRQATADDLLVLPSSSVIATVNQAYYTQLVQSGVPAATAGQLSVNGITYPLRDQWVLIPDEQMAVKTATDAYNATIEGIAQSKGLALVDFKSILEQASTIGYSDGDFTFNTSLVTGGLISLDGVHLTSRGYAVMANAMLMAIDATYGSNFEASGNLVDSGDYPTNYPPTLQ